MTSFIGATRIRTGISTVQGSRLTDWTMAPREEVRRVRTADLGTVRGADPTTHDLLELPDAGIEPATQRWQGHVMPLHQSGGRMSLVTCHSSLAGPHPRETWATSDK